MRIRTLAALVAAACAAPCALAQQPSNPVTLYGRVYATFESIEAQGDLGTPGAGGACAAPNCAAALPRRNRIGDQSSYLGVRGTETLGADFKAFFELETQ